MSRNPVPARNELPQKLFFRPPESRHVDASLTAAHDAKQPNHWHLAEVVALGFAATEFLNLFKKVDQILE